MSCGDCLLAPRCTSARCRLATDAVQKRLHSLPLEQNLPQRHSTPALEMDTVSREKRSAIMAAVRGSQNCSTELRMIAVLRAARISGWRRGAVLPGKPDFIFRAARVAMFVDGCFWHGCPRHGRTPKTHASFWTAKLARNVRRDRTVTRELRASGWIVLRVWECALSHPNLRRTLARIVRALAHSAPDGGRSRGHVVPFAKRTQPPI